MLIVIELLKVMRKATTISMLADQNIIMRARLNKIVPSDMKYQ